jgi:BolA protein
MSLQKTIEEKLTARFDPRHLAVINESHQHNVPDGSESHFKVVLVSGAFEGKNLVTQHRMVYELLFEELQSQVHALALHTYTPSAWSVSEAPASPECMGGKTKEGA